MDGYQVLEALRQEDMNSMVIVVSDDIQPIAQERVMSMGAAFVKKPISFDALNSVLKQYGVMMTLAALTNDQRDALQELTNIAMVAGSSLATLLDAFVDLSVPRIRVVEVVELPSTLSDLVGKNNW